MNDEIRPDQLAQTVQDVLQTYAKATADQLAEVTKDTADKAAQIVRQQAAAAYGGKYAKAIQPRYFKDINVNGGRRVSEFITAGSRYRIAHLLENGHAKVAGGRTVGRVEGTPHFAAGQNYIDRNFIENLKRKIEEGTE